jgi:hypothetical protein
MPEQALRAVGGWGCLFFLDSSLKKVARLSALRTGRFYPPVDKPGTRFLEAESPAVPQCFITD